MAIFAPTRYTPGNLQSPASQHPNYGGWDIPSYRGGRQGPPQPLPGYEVDPWNPQQHRKKSPQQDRLDYERRERETTARLREESLFQQQQQKYYADQARQARGDQRTEQVFNTQMGAVRGLTSAFGGGRSSNNMPYNQGHSQMGFGIGSGGGYGTSAPVNYAPVSISPVPDASAAQNAAFGAAKAQAGSMGRSALESLRSGLTERGVLGGGTEARGLVDILAASTNPLSDINVAQQQERLGIAQHAQDLATQRATTQYGGGITQRGQDIQERQAQAALAQQRQSEQLRLLQQALAGLSVSY